MANMKLLIRILAATVAATMAMAPVTAFAEGGKEIEAYDGNKKEDLGDVKADGEYEQAVTIWADGHKAEVTTGNIESAESNGLYTWAEHNAEIDVDVTGDINTPAATSTGEEHSASGVTTNVLCGSKNDINVTGNIVSGYEGITAKTSDYYEDRKDEGDYGDSKTDISVNGNITADKSAINLSASLGGENHIEVNGDVTGFAKGGDDPERDDAVIWIQATDPDSRNDVFVKGDVTGDRIGVWVVVPAENTGYPENNVVIDGTLSANVAAVQVDDRLGEGKFKNSITVWKIETPGFTAAKWEPIGEDEENPQFNLVEDEETEKNIRYIISVNQNDHATLTATDADGKALATVTGVGGSVLEYAHEGDKVLLKIDVDDDYRLNAVYGDEGQKLELVKDGNGNYYIMVPRNGGVIFSVDLSRISHSDDDNKENKTSGDQGTWTYGLSDSAAIALINATPAGGSVTLSPFTGTCLSAPVVKQLLARRDINVTITFMFKGMLYKIVIPAGDDLTKLVGADGTISFFALGQAFGITLAG